MSNPKAMSAANGAQRQLELTPTQLAAMLVIDAQVAQLQIAANQLGGFLKMTREADLIVSAMKVLAEGKERLVQEWARKVQIVPAGALPAIEGKG